jgi:hypothetical protein
MRVLLLGDSHCREMDILLPVNASTNTVKLYVISVGGTTAAIMTKYHSSLPEVNNFGPDSIILHSGNNELGYHPTKNLNPRDSTQTTAILLAAAHVLKLNHPQAIIVLSAAFPRLLSRSSHFTFEDLTHYNDTARRHSNRLRSEAKKVHFHTLLNNIMWKNKDSLLVKTHFFLEDGLHLTNDAKKLVIADWIRRLQTINP